MLNSGGTHKQIWISLTLNADLKPWLKVGTNTSIAFSKDNLGLTNSQDGIISQALLSSPDVPIYNTDGTYSGDQREGSPGRINPIGKALDETNQLISIFIKSIHTVKKRQ